MTATVTLGGGSAAAAATSETPPSKPRQAADDCRETDHIRAAYARMRF